MHVGSHPLITRACRSSKVFGGTLNGSAALSAAGRSGRVATAVRCQPVAAAQASTRLPVKKHGAVSVQGTSRKRNEDRFDLQACTRTLAAVLERISTYSTSTIWFDCQSFLQVDDEADAGQPAAYVGVFDGHGQSGRCISCNRSCSAVSTCLPILLCAPAGGVATSDWLERNFADYLGEHWSDGQTPERDITRAFLQVRAKCART